MDIGRDGFETDAAYRLFAPDLAVERLEAAPHVERGVVRFAEQQCEIGRAFILQGLDGGIERDAGVSLAAAILAGQHPADAAGAHFAPVPFDLAAVDADVADDIVS